MPEFQYQHIVLRHLPDLAGWQVIGIKHDQTRELLATVLPSLGERIAQRWADIAAFNLTGKAFARVE